MLTAITAFLARWAWTRAIKKYWTVAAKWFAPAVKKAVKWWNGLKPIAKWRVATAASMGVNVLLVLLLLRGCGANPVQTPGDPVTVTAPAPAGKPVKPQMPGPGALDPAGWTPGGKPAYTSSRFGLCLVPLLGVSLANGKSPRPSFGVRFIQVSNGRYGIQGATDLKTVGIGPDASLGFISRRVRNALISPQYRRELLVKGHGFGLCLSVATGD